MPATADPDGRRHDVPLRTDGIEAALEQAIEAAGGADIRLGGGASTIRQYSRAGLLDEIHVVMAPVLLGGGERLFEASPRRLRVRRVHRLGPGRPRAPGPVDRNTVDVVVAVDREVAVERLDLGGGAWVDVARGWMAGADALFDDLLHEVAWQTSRLFRYDHFVEERRLGAVVAAGPAAPAPGAGRGDPHAPAPLQRAVRRASGCCSTATARDGQAFHRDTDMRWLDDTVIAILSLGARRPWLLRPRTSRHDHSPGKGATHDLAPGLRRPDRHGRPHAGGLGALGAVPRRPAGRAPDLDPVALRPRRGRPFMGARYGAPLTYGRGRPPRSG